GHGLVPGTGVGRGGERVLGAPLPGTESLGAGVPPPPGPGPLPLPALIVMLAPFGTRPHGVTSTTWLSGPSTGWTVTLKPALTSSRRTKLTDLPFTVLQSIWSVSAGAEFPD